MYVATNMLTPEQLELRKTGMAATDVVAILGLSSYRGPIDIWREKMGIGVPFDGNIRTKFGLLLEPMIRADYEERHDVRVELHGTMKHPKHDYWLYTPDGLVFPRNSIHAAKGLEIKTHNRDAITFGRLEYGAPGSDEVPPGELVQCMWSIGGSGLDRWDLVVFDGAPTEYVIDRDDDLIGMLQQEAEKFLIDYVKTKTPPPADGSKSWNDYLAAKFSQKDERLLVIDSMPETMALVRALRATRESFFQTKTEKDIIEQNLKAVIGDHAGLAWNEIVDGKKVQRKITWRKAADSSEVDYHAAWRSNVTDAQLALSTFDEKETYDGAVNTLIAALKNIADEKRSIATYSSTVDGSRRFLTPSYWKKNPEGN